MPWVRLDDQFYNHPKLPSLGSYMLPCVGLHTLALCYASAYLTDGFIPKAQVPRLAGDLALLLPEGNPWELCERLVSVTLWEESDGGYMIHDFLDYNPSRRSVLQLRKTRSISGQAGGLAKDKQKASKRQAKFRQNHAPSPSPSPYLESKEEPPLSLSLPQGFKLDPIFFETLDKLPRFKGDPKLREQEWWQAMIQAYRNIDHLEELRKAHGWLVTKAKGKHRRDMAGFLRNWFERAESDTGEVM